MKNMRLSIIGILLAGVMLTSAQAKGETSANMLALWKDSSQSVETSTKALEQAAKIAAAADYLKLALVLGLGMLIGRTSAISHRELKELKSALTRLAGSNSQ